MIIKTSASLKLLASLLTLTAPAFAATTILVNDTFSDNERLTDSGGTPQTSLDWSVLRNGAATATVSGGALTFSPNATLFTNFTSVTLSPSITFITLSFDFSVATISNLQSFRFGLINSASQLSVDTSSTNINGAAAYAGATGYSFFGGIGPTVSNGVNRLGNTFDAPGTGLVTSGANPALGSTFATTAMTAGKTYQASITISYISPTSVSVSSTLNGSTLPTVTDNTSPIFAFNNFWLFSQQNGAFTLDNFLLTAETTAVPEPSAAALMAGLASLGGAFGLRRRKRQ